MEGVQTHGGLQTGEGLTCGGADGQWCSRRAWVGGPAAPTVGLGGDAALGVGGQALAQPHLLPGGVGDGVPEPAVGDLVDHVDQQELAALQDGGDDEGQAGVLHGNDGEGGGQEDDVTPVGGAAMK